MTPKESLLVAFSMGLLLGLVLIIGLRPQMAPPRPCPESAVVVHYDRVWTGVGDESVVVEQEDGWTILKVLKGGGYAGELMRFRTETREFKFGPAPANWRGSNR